jgi:hypothetical protein
MILSLFWLLRELTNAFKSGLVTFEIRGIVDGY